MTEHTPSNAVPNIYNLFRIHTQSELEALQQDSARTYSVVQSLRQQVTEAEGRRRDSSHSSLTDLQTQTGRLRSELKDKVRVEQYHKQIFFSDWPYLSEHEF